MATALVKTADPEKDGHLNTSRPYHLKITARPFLFITETAKVLPLRGSNS